MTEKSEKKKRKHKSEGSKESNLESKKRKTEKTKKKTSKQKSDHDEEASKRKTKKSVKHETENKHEAFPTPDKLVEHSIDEPDQRSTTAANKSKVKKSKRHQHKKAAKEEPSDEADVSKKESVESLCLEYLRTWKCNHKRWTFKKVRQVWLLQNMYNCDKIPDEDFETMLEYMKDLKGRARQLTAEKAEMLLSSEEDPEKDEKLSEAQSERVRQVVQLLT